MRLIDADALIEKCGEWYVEEGPEDGFIGTIKQLIDTQPTIQSDTTTHDSIPVETGKKDDYGTSGDCISRQQAINKIKPWLEVKGYSWGELNMLRAVINELENMPSAQPETSCSEFPNNCPAADVVPVVRCKDCKDAYCRTYQNWQEPIYTCTRFRSKWNTDYDLEVNPDDFCSYGKRKE